MPDGLLNGENEKIYCNIYGDMSNYKIKSVAIKRVDKAWTNLPDKWNRRCKKDTTKNNTNRYYYTFKNALTQNDNGTYECTITYSYQGEDMKSYYKIQYNIAQAPVITESPDEIRGVIAGDPNLVTLNCTAGFSSAVFKNKKPFVEWTIDSSCGTFNSTSSISGSGELKYKDENIEKEACRWTNLHLAIYTCTVYFDDPINMDQETKKRFSSSASGKIMVYQKPNPLLIIDPEEILEDQQITITCRDQNEDVYPRPNFKLQMPNGTMIEMKKLVDSNLNVRSASVPFEEFTDETDQYTFSSSSYRKRRGKSIRYVRQAPETVTSSAAADIISTQSSLVPTVSADNETVKPEIQPIKYEPISQITQLANMDWNGEVKCIGESIFEALEDESKRNQRIETSQILSVKYKPKFLSKENIYLPSKASKYTATVCSVKSKPGSLVEFREAEYMSSLVSKDDTNSTEEQVTSVEYEFVDIQNMSFPVTRFCSAKNSIEEVGRVITVNFASVSSPVRELSGTVSTNSISILG